MTLRVCMDCTTAFAVGAPRCPHCGSERSAEEGTALALGVYARGRVEEDDMPKITRHGGASDRHTSAEAKPVPLEDRGVLGELAPEVANFRPTEGGEQPSAGSSGETSSAQPSTTSGKSGTPRRSRARKTANRSAQDTTESSTARSTDGGPEADASATDDSADA